MRLTDSTYAYALGSVPRAKMCVRRCERWVVQGFMYEARAVRAALEAGLLEPPQWTHDETVSTQAIVDAIRKAVKQGASGAGELVIPKWR